MKKVRKFAILLISIIALMTGIVGCSSPSASKENKKAENKVWKIGHVRPAGTIADVDVNAFAEDLAAKTDGTIKLEIYPAGQLGDYTVVQERVSIGDIQMQLAPLATNLDKAFGISSAPYLVENWEQAKKVYASGSTLNNAMAEKLEKNGIKLLGTYPLYFGGIGLVKEAAEPGNPDVSKGVKIRVPAMKSFEKTAEALGYISTPLPFAEAFTAMQTGIVEGAIGSGAEGYYSNFKDLVKYYLPVNDHFEMWYLYVSKDAFDKLTASEQKALQDAAKQMEEKRFEEAEAQEKEYEKKLEENGVKVINFSDAELATFAKKCRQEVWPVVKGDYGEDLFDSITKEIE